MFRYQALVHEDGIQFIPQIESNEIPQRVIVVVAFPFSLSWKDAFSFCSRISVKLLLA